MFTTTTYDTAAGSTVAAGGNLRLSATGAGEGADLTVRGSTLSAGGNARLKADGDINLLAAQNTVATHRSSSRSSAGVGGAISVGQGGVAMGVSANASRGKGKGDGKEVTWSNTQVSAGERLALVSGDDTHLRGALASGRQVVADVGGNLNIESQQDTSAFKSKDSHVGGSVAVGAGFSASANVGKQKIDSDYASVTGQSRIEAGDGGFQIKVKGNTDLKGAALASSGQAVKEGLNRLTSGTLTVSDIENRAEYKAGSVGIGGGYSVGNGASGGVGTNQQGQAATGDQVPGTTLPTYGNFSASPPIAMAASGNSRSTTRSGVSGGVIEIRDPTAQQALTGKRVDETVASLNRDVFTGRAGANALKPIFNEQEIKAGFEIVGALQRETGTFLNNRAREATAARLALEQELARPEGERDPARLAALQQQVTDSAVWAPGGTGRQVLTALAAAAGGNVIGSTSQFAQNMLINYVQQQGASYIGKLVKEGSLIEGSPLHATLHAIVACAGSAASKQDCGSGALGAAASSLLTNLFNDTPDDATPEQKEAKRNLLTSLVSGIALAGGQEVATAVNSALSAVENNFLGATSSDKLDKAVEKIMNGDKSLATANELIKLENADKRSDALVSKFIKDPAQLTRSERAELAGYLRIYASEMEKEYGPAVSQELVNGLLSGQDYMKRNPDSEAMAKAQSIMNTWGYHKSNASIGDAPLMFGSSVLGTTIKEGMALNAAIGVVVNTGVQFGGDDHFSYVDAIMAGVTAAATTGKSWQASAAINMGGAAISSAIKGEDPTNSTIAAGVGSIFGSSIGKVATEQLKPAIKENSAEIIGTVTGSTVGEVTGNTVKNKLDKGVKKNGKN